MNFGVWIFLIVVILGLINAIKNKGITKLDISLLIIIVVVYYLIAYFFDNELLSPFIFTENSFTISSLGIILLFGTFLLIKYVITKLKEVNVDN